MKKIITLTALSLAATALFAFDPDNFAPKAQVSSYTKSTYTISSKFGNYFRTLSKKTIYNYDSGKVTESLFYTATDQLISKTAYTYSDGKLSQTVSNDAEGNMVEKETLEYAADGSLKDYSVYRGNNLYSKTVYKTENGRQDKSEYDQDGALVTKTVSKLEAGRVTEENCYLETGDLLYRSTYTYTSSGAADSITKVLSEDNSIQKTVFHYDTNGFLTEETTTDADGKTTQRIIYRNNEDGDPVKVSYYSVTEKFGTTVNELTAMYEFSYSK